MLPFLYHLCILSSFHSFPSVIHQISKYTFLQISVLKGTISIEKQFSRFQISFPWKVVPWTLSIGSDKHVAVVTSTLSLEWSWKFIASLNIAHSWMKTWAHYSRWQFTKPWLQNPLLTQLKDFRIQEKIHFRKDSASSFASNLWILSYCGIPALDFSSRHVPSFLVFYISCFRALKQNKTAFKTVVFHYDL